jgi:hypothetical protein
MLPEGLCMDIHVPEDSGNMVDSANEKHLFSHPTPYIGFSRVLVNITSEKLAIFQEKW